MLKKLPTLLKGSLNVGALAVNTIGLSTPLFSLAAAKLLPIQQLQKASTQGCIKIAETWIGINSYYLEKTQDTQYHITGELADINYDGWYMVIANHQSWADIFVLQKIFNRRAPMLKFFLKQELIYVPVIGLCWWALDFPFMKRYSKEFLAKHPELKGKDLETTRQACEKFKHTPVSIMNFLEGTRFTTAKHKQQQSPYKHLLKPKAAGIAYALNIMNERIDTLVDVTIDYPDGIPSFWDFMAGKTQNVNIHIQKRAIPSELQVGSYEEDAKFRTQFQQWINQIWQEKDDRLQAMQQQTQVMPENVIAFKQAS
ncbi:acyltransferase [Agitococcus lubricus]|uniref:1-acyl-sn-glycerol-3-phosphate acyltransferase n=1 Tax=Agitococcus lubricus TaxID=1077255 RepID=A0A2T5IVT3_9GAMM|nr:acyltransferase [Agitococcus lubricus]PTQ87997.1 1-acyl-sn-glycerol-3-phosphate acyltransferase [Agitococcus lubricus]